MIKVDVILPKMGESVSEATLIAYTKNVGDFVEEDDIIAEVATDKVDSEVPSPVSGKIIELRFSKDDVIQVGQIMAIIETEGETETTQAPQAPKTAVTSAPTSVAYPPKNIPSLAVPPMVSATNGSSKQSNGKKIYSPLVRTIAKEEKIDAQELASIQGTGVNGRVTKRDMVHYLENRTKHSTSTSTPIAPVSPAVSNGNGTNKAPAISFNGSDDTIIEMDRMRLLIANHMVESKKVSPHVSTFLKVDVTDIVEWRKQNKSAFQERYNHKLTYTPIFIQAVVNAIKDFPLINGSLNGNQIVVKNRINIGMATALPSGNLIVPVIKDADRANLAGLASSVNELAQKARNNQLKPGDIQDGTFTISNIGTFGNDAGTPIINQPQLAILALGAIRKEPAVVETEIGDVIAIRHKMILSISFDHRVIDGFLGGSFLRKVGDYIEQFDTKANI